MIEALLTSDWAIGMIAGALAGWLAKAISASPDKYQRWYGYALKAVKLAEHAIPDGIDNKAAAKADYALQRFIEDYEEATGKTIEAPMDKARVEEMIERALQEYKSAREESKDEQ